MMKNVIIWHSLAFVDNKSQLSKGDFISSHGRHPPEVGRPKSSLLSLNSLQQVLEAPDILIDNDYADPYQPQNDWQIKPRIKYCQWFLKNSYSVITTGLHKKGGMNDSDYEDFLKKCAATHALGRPGDASEVSSVIVFLASEAASNITGATLPVDGGRHAMCPR
ncbi:unnamed protein product [Pieris brassicae]|uniref:Uncharacterized protein n=1 Tax=Pieris brassicae TaxID=7116 RepID=A0A9P0XL23_PIEBR|nr:unnamed protein product [Pieris brassicae]